MTATEGATVVIFFKELKSSVVLSGNTLLRMGSPEKNLLTVPLTFIRGPGTLYPGVDLMHRLIGPSLIWDPGAAVISIMTSYTYPFVHLVGIYSLTPVVLRIPGKSRKVSALCKKLRRA